jgi:hypothetical protein
VQVAGGRRGEAHADWRVWAHETMLTGEGEAHHLLPLPQSDPSMQRLKPP